MDFGIFTISTNMVATRSLPQIQIFVSNFFPKGSQVCLDSLGIDYVLNHLHRICGKKKVQD
jgi:hypothetical protein